MENGQRPTGWKGAKASADNKIRKQASCIEELERENAALRQQLRCGLDEPAPDRMSQLQAHANKALDLIVSALPLRGAAVETLGAALRCESVRTALHGYEVSGKALLRRLSYMADGDDAARHHTNAIARPVCCTLERALSSGDADVLSESSGAGRDGLHIQYGPIRGHKVCGADRAA